MSCGSIDGFKNILGDAFKDLKAALSCVDNTTAAIAEQQEVLTVQLEEATSVITPEMVTMAFAVSAPDAGDAAALLEGGEPPAPEFTYEDLQTYIGGIGASIGDFASQAVSQSGSLVEGLQTSIIGGQANYSLDSALGNGDTPQGEKFSDLTEKTSSICETIGNGLVSIMDAIESTLAKIGEAVQEILAAIGSGVGALADAMRKVFTALSDAAAQVVQFVGDAIAAVAGAIGEMVSAAAQAIKDAFCKGMELAFPTMGPDYTPPADLAGTEYI